MFSGNRRLVRMRVLLRVLGTLSIFLVIGLLGYVPVTVLAEEVASPTPTSTFVPTATVVGPHVYVPELVNVRTGPETTYEKVGVLISGQTAPALGRTALGEWIAIDYPAAPEGIAWVYAPLVILRDSTMDDLSRLDRPPTPTFAPTITPLPISGEASRIDPMPTRLPTFTPAPAVEMPTFAPQYGGESSFPPILAIVSLFVLGILSGLVALLQQRG